MEWEWSLSRKMNCTANIGANLPTQLRRRSWKISNCGATTKPLWMGWERNGSNNERRLYAPIWGGFNFGFTGSKYGKSSRERFLAQALVDIGGTIA